MIAVLGVLAAGGLTYAASLFSGRMLLRSLGLKLFRSEEWFLGFVLGSAVLSTLVFLLTAAGLAYSGVFLGLGAAVLCLGLWRGAYRSSGEALPPLAIGWRIGFLAIYAVFALIYLEAALVPETGPDAMLYHVALPARYLSAHHFPANTRNLLANLSEGVELLFLFAYPLARESAGAIVHLLFLLVMPWGMLSYGRRAGFPIAGGAGGLLFFAAPIVGKLGTRGYIDVALASYAFALFLLLDTWRERRTTGTLIAIGLLAGFCFDVKYTAAAAIPYAIGYTSFYLWRERKPPWRAAALIAVCALAVMSPYLVKNVVVTGNPVAPFANRIFPNALFTPALEAQYADVMRHWEGVTWKEIPRELLIGGGRLQGIVGPLFLLAPLALFALRYPAGRRLWMAAAAFGIAYPASIATRFLVPALPFVSIALALVFQRWRYAPAGLALLHAVLSWPTIVPTYCDPYCWRLSDLRLRPALRLESADDYLHRAVAEYDIGHAIQAQVPAGQPVFAFQGFQQLYQTREIVVGWESTFGSRLSAALMAPVWKSIEQSFQFPKRPVRRLRVLQTGSSKDSEWGVTELRVLRGGREIPRSTKWWISASDNRHDVSEAFDNNPVTRWASARLAGPGMWIQLDFGASEIVDQVVISTSDREQGTLRLMLDSSGQWQPLAASPDEYEVPHSSVVRLAATQGLKQAHLDWLLIRSSDLIAGDVAARPGRWGLSVVTMGGEYRLYHID